MNQEYQDAQKQAAGFQKDHQESSRETKDYDVTFLQPENPKILDPFVWNHGWFETPHDTQIDESQIDEKGVILIRDFSVGNSERRDPLMQIDKHGLKILTQDPKRRLEMTRVAARMVDDLHRTSFVNPEEMKITDEIKQHLGEKTDTEKDIDKELKKVAKESMSY